MSDFAIDVINFEFWDGPPPVVPTQKVTVAHRPGVSSVSHTLLGVRGDTFSVNLTSHWATFLDAQNGHVLMNALIGTGGKQVKYNGLNWSGMYGVMYNVDAVDLIDLHAAIYLIGPGYAYANGASLLTRFTLTPQAT